PSQGNGYQEDFSCSESNSESSATEEESDSDAAGQQHGHTPSTSAQSQKDQEEPCRYYNSGHCRDGKRCHYRHVCKYALKGNCRNGTKCRLKHPSSSSDRDGSGGKRERRRSSSGGRGGGGGRERRRSSSGGRGGGGGGRERRSSSSGGRGRGGRERRRSSSGGRGGGGRRDRRRSLSGVSRGDGARERSSSRGTQLDFSGPYKWQLDDGHGWKDIANDHILEAQAVSIDFKAMRVRGKKNLRLRRLDGQQTEWIWFYSNSKGWTKYGEKDPKGNPGPIQSSAIEKKFQSNRNGSLTFNIGSDTIEIRFRQMRQVSSKRKRKVVRRPKYQPPQSGNLTGRVTSAFQRIKMSPAGQSGSPEWQFGGKSGRWHTFKDSASSVSSADIEDQYQQDSNGSMSFTVNGQAYKLDFSAMTQTNLSTRVTRNIRRK
ncbi:unnamed protein product, partial [Coregonus sp. 'balchen']